MYPKSRYATECVCFECHVVAWRYALHENIELSAGFDSWSRALAGADHGAHGGGDRSVFGIERMYRDITRRCAVCGRSLHSQFLIELEWESVLFSVRSAEAHSNPASSPKTRS